MATESEEAQLIKEIAELAEAYNTAATAFNGVGTAGNFNLSYPEVPASVLATADSLSTYGTSGGDEAAEGAEGESDSSTGVDSAIVGFSSAMIAALQITTETDTATSGAGGAEEVVTTLMLSGIDAIHLGFSNSIIAPTNLGTLTAEMMSASEYDGTAYEYANYILDKLQKLQDIADGSVDLDDALSDVDATDEGAVAEAIADAQAEAAAKLAAEAAAEIAARKAAQESLKESLGGEITKIQILYKEQCFLMSQVDTLVQYKYTADAQPVGGKKLPYQDGAGNACILAVNDPFTFMNKLTQYPGTPALHHIKPQNLSNLVPMIRLYKVSSDDSGNESQIEFEFNSNPTFNEIQRYMVDKDKRGFGAGVKDFSFTYDGSNPFSAKKSIRAQLSIFANGFDELFMCRGNGECDSDIAEEYNLAYRYIDLALKTGKTSKKDEVCNEEAKINLSKLEFRLKAVVGWAEPSGFPNPEDDYDLKDAIGNSFVVLNLTPTIHEFKVEEDGSVNFTINYLAYIEEFFDQPQFNIFAEPTVACKSTLRRLIFENITNSETCLSSEIAELKKSEADAIVVEKRKSLEYLTQRLLAKGEDGKSKMKYINLKREELLKYQNSGQFYTLPEGGVENLIIDDVTDPGAVEAAQKKELDAAEKAETGDEKAADPLNFSELMLEPGSEQIPFFFVSDLIDIILEGIAVNLKQLPGCLDTPYEDLENLFQSTALKSGVVDKGAMTKQITEHKKVLQEFDKRFEKLRLVLGPMEVRSPQGAGWDAQSVSLGDLPVSYKYFLEWLTKKVLALNEREYHLAQFLNDFFNTLVTQFINSDTCFKIKPPQKLHLQQAALTSYRASADDPDRLTAAINNYHIPFPYYNRLAMDTITESQWPLLGISGLTNTGIIGDIDREINYLIFFAGRVGGPAEELNGNIEEDEAKGIFHYSMGRSDGLVKRINLSKTTAKYLKEVRFEQEGYDGLKQLKEVYDVEIDAFPIVNAFPGVYIYVDPHGWLPNAGKPTSDVPLDLTQYGIGGYHMIWKSTHSFASGRAESKIFAKWVAAKYPSEGNSCAMARSSNEMATDPPKPSPCAEAIAALTAGTEETPPAAGTEVGDAPADAG